MSLSEPTTALAREVERLTTLLARAEERRDALVRRGRQLEGEVAQAKGRLAVRGEVERVIEEVQAEASRRNVASFEALLTALVQEVLPGEKPVSLELTTERGLAALDIGLRRPDGSREDVLEDNGGALTNVVGAALRLIAVVKAGVGRFLALDEADCWIAPERVPAFYRVLEDSAARLQVQCLVISHHDLGAFEGRLRVARIRGEPIAGVGLACPELEEPWDEHVPGLRHIRLVDVQGFRDATLTLGPGVNALVGPNNRGKSTVIRALRAVFYGEARDSLVRAGAREAVVEVGLAGGRVLRFSRQPRRTPVNLWSLHEADGSVVEERGLRHETGGRSVPDWVDRLVGIRKVEELDVHIAHQKFPVFLLGEPASRRSAVLAIGQEAGYLRDMLALHKERCHRDLATVRNGERELLDIAAALDEFRDLGDVAESIARARAALATLAAGEARLSRAEAAAAGLAAARARLAATAGRREALRELPAPGRPAALAAALEGAAGRAFAAQRVRELGRRLAAARKRAEHLAALPREPAVASTRTASEARERLRRTARSLAAAEARRREALAALSSLKAEIERLVEAAGGLCPACGGPADAEALLRGHAHARAA